VELKERTRLFARRIIHMSTALPADRVGYVIARQLVKSGTSPGAHFRESLRARSKSEYTAKLNGGLMELEETLYWLEIIRDEQFISLKKIQPLIKETEELIAIFVSLINKWRKK
jgi:four helix bundle protein